MDRQKDGQIHTHIETETQKDKQMGRNTDSETHIHGETDRGTKT